jgi:hypothetical protein
VPTVPRSDLNELSDRGLPTPTERVNVSRLTVQQVRDLRLRAMHGELVRVLAADYGVSRGFVSMVVSRQRLVGPPYEQAP